MNRHTFLLLTLLVVFAGCQGAIPHSVTANAPSERATDPRGDAKSPPPSTPTARLGDPVCALSDGTLAENGRTVAAPDGCNECTCKGSGWSCTEMDC